MIIGTFSDTGPKKCSGLDILQYNEESLSETFSDHFELLRSEKVEHITPFNTTQNFIFGVFKRRT